MRDVFFAFRASPRPYHHHHHFRKSMYSKGLGHVKISDREVTGSGQTAISEKCRHLTKMSCAGFALV